MGFIDRAVQIFKGPKKPLPANVVKDRSIITGEQLQTNLLTEAIFRYVTKVAAVMQNNPLGLLNDSYLRNSTVYSIIKRKASAATTIPWLLYEVSNQKAYVRALQLKHQFSQGIDGRPAMHLPVHAFLSKSDLKEVQSHKIFDIIEEPNPTQSWSDLTEALLGNLNIHGNCYEYGIGPRNGANKGQFHQLWDLPAQITTLVPDKNNPRLISEFYVNGMYTDPIPSEQVSHTKYWNPQYGNDYTQLYGLSPISAARYTIQQSNDNIISMITQLQNIGALGIIGAKGSLEGEPSFTQEQAKEIKDTWERKYAGIENHGKIAFTPGSVEWHQLGLSPVDLAIIESMNMTDRQICNAFSFPSLLLGDSTQKTFANYKEAKKALFTDSVIPDLIKLKEKRNKWFLKPFSTAENKKYIFDLDYTAVPELQEDIKDMIAAYKDAYWITNNEKRVLMKYGETAEEGDDKTYIPNSFTATDESMIAQSQADAAIKELTKAGINDYN